MRRPSSATIRPEGGALPAADDDQGEEQPTLTLAQRLLMANEENTFDLRDLWVSAAIAQDTAVFDDEEEGDEGADAMTPDVVEDSLHPTPRTRNGSVSPFVHGAGGDSIGPSTFGRSLGVRAASGAGRRQSAASSNLPAIFANTGLNTPPAIAAAWEQDPLDDVPHSPLESGGGGGFSGLAPIQERQSRVPSQALSDSRPMSPEPGEEKAAVKTTGWRLLPLLMILQYGLLALHDTVHGQVFLSFLVS